MRPIDVHYVYTMYIVHCVRPLRISRDNSYFYISCQSWKYDTFGAAAWKCLGKNCELCIVFFCSYTRIYDELTNGFSHIKRNSRCSELGARERDKVVWTCGWFHWNLIYLVFIDCRTMRYRMTLRQVFLSSHSFSFFCFFNSIFNIRFDLRERFIISSLK